MPPDREPALRGPLVEEGEEPEIRCTTAAGFLIDLF